MISFLEGTIIQLEATFLTLAVGGVGFSMRISLNTFSQLNSRKENKQNCLIYTHLHYNQTDGPSLFGFENMEERRLFLHLISVNGIGPSIALVALSSVQPSQLLEAIAREDVKSIQSLKGIGPKTAQRLILELRDKIKKENPKISPSGTVVSGAQKTVDDALSALTTLGIPKPTAEKILDSILKQEQKSYTTEELIRLALKRNA